MSLFRNLILRAAFLRQPGEMNLQLRMQSGARACTQQTLFSPPRQLREHLKFPVCLLRQLGSWMTCLADTSLIPGPVAPRASVFRVCRFVTGPFSFHPSPVQFVGLLLDNVPWERALLASEEGICSTVPEQIPDRRGRAASRAAVGAFFLPPTWFLCLIPDGRPWPFVSFTDDRLILWRRL